MIRKVVGIITDSVRYYKSLKAVFSQDISLKSEAVNNTIVINTINVCQLSTLFIETLIAQKLRQKGAEVIHLIDDNILKFIDLEYYYQINVNRPFHIRERISWYLLKYFNKYTFYSSLIEPSDIEYAYKVSKRKKYKNNFVFVGVDISESIESSLVRAHRSSINFVNQKENSNLKKIIAENAIISLIIARNVNSKFNPDIIITSHGIYSSYRPFYEYFKKEKKKMVTWSLSDYHFGHVVFSKRGLVGNRCDDGFFIENNDRINLDKSTKYTKNTMLIRKQQKSADQRFFKKSGNDVSILDDIIKLKNSGNDLYCLFPNIFWDNSLTGTNLIFDTAEQWLIDTIEFFKENRVIDSKLVIRAHPNECNTDTLHTTKNIIESYFGCNVNTINNIIFIDSESSMSSYSLFPLIRAGLVYNGSIGLELMLDKIPVFIAGLAPYSFKGFTYDCINQKDYFELFKQPEKVIQKVDLNLLRKYFYFYFYMNHIPLHAMAKNKHASITNLDSDRFFEGDSALNHIVETILSKDMYFQNWCENER